MIVIGKIQSIHTCQNAIIPINNSLHMKISILYIIMTILLTGCSPYMKGNLPLNENNLTQFSFSLNQEGQGIIKCYQYHTISREQKNSTVSSRSMSSENLLWLKKDIEALIKDKILTSDKNESSYSDFPSLELKIYIEGTPYFYTTKYMSPENSSKRIHVIEDNINKVFNNN